MDEQRAWSRVPCQLGATCETFEGIPPILASYPATVMNLSSTGVCLAVSEQFQQGSMLFLKLPDPTKAFWCGRSACVVHTKALPTHLLLVCQFAAPLTES